jgi:hypothetical protein
VPEPVGRMAERRAAPPDGTLDIEVRRLVERSTAVQGLPFHVTDEAVLARVAALVRNVRGQQASRLAS